MEALWRIEADVKEPEVDVRALFQRLSRGDLNALEPLYENLAARIYGLALWRTGSSADASDVVQEVFVKLASHAKQLGSIRHPVSYALRIAHFACVDRLRIKRREGPIEELLLLPDSSERFNSAEDLSGLILELPPEQREAIYLRYFVGFSFKEISTATGVTLFTAASRCRLAVRKLKNRLGVMK